MNKTLLAAATAALAITGAHSGALAAGHAVPIGVILGFTGPIESLTPAMASGAELAMAEVTASGALLGGKALNSVRADSTCIDAAAATAAAGIAIEVGQNAISTPSMAFKPSFTESINVAAAAAVLFIFQLPAINGVLMMIQTLSHILNDK